MASAVAASARRPRRRSNQQPHPRARLRHRDPRNQRLTAITAALIRRARKYVRDNVGGSCEPGDPCTGQLVPTKVVAAEPPEDTRSWLPVQNIQGASGSWSIRWRAGVMFMTVIATHRYIGLDRHRSVINKAWSECRT